MNGIYIHITFLIFSMLSIDCYVLRQVTSQEPGFPSAKLDTTENLSNDEPLKRNNYPDKIEKLMCLLRKHQNDEEDLKFQIRRLLTGFRIPQNREAAQPFMQICKCQHRSVKDVLSMLNLSPNQNELLEKIISMMQGRSCRHAGGKTKMKMNEVHNVATNLITTATEKIIFKENVPNKGYDDEITLNQNQLENIAYEVVEIIKRTPDLKIQLYRNEFGKLVLPDGDTPPSEATAAST